MVGQPFDERNLCTDCMDYDPPVFVKIGSDEGAPTDTEDYRTVSSGTPQLNTKSRPLVA